LAKIGRWQAGEILFVL